MAKEKGLGSGAAFNNADLPNHLYYLDNKMIELYFASQERLLKDEKHAALELEVFLHHLKQMRKGLSYLISLPFVKFWAVPGGSEPTKTDRVGPSSKPLQFNFGICLGINSSGTPLKFSSSLAFESIIISL